MPQNSASQFKGVFGLMLALPCSFFMQPAQASDQAGAFASLTQTLAAEEAVLQGWREYARSRIVPEFDWADFPEATVPDLTTVAFATPNRQRFTRGEGRFGISVEHSRSNLRDGARSGPGAFAPMRLDDLAPVGFRQEIFSPGVIAATRFGDLEMGAVFAYQRFASWDFGMFSGGDVGVGVMADRSGRTESSFGQGVRVGMSGPVPVLRGIDYSLSYRSRVDMDAFNNYRGAYLSPGDFDLPAELSLAFGFRIAPSLKFSLGVDQIQYSDVQPFLSTSLPNRVLALLGDGGSPEFRWRDLNVYRAELAWQASDNDAFVLRYSTRQQPTPTSSALRTALAQDYTNNNLAFAYVRRLNAFLQLGFAASYASSSYFLGQPDVFLRTPRDGRQIEGELVLTALF